MCVLIIFRKTGKMQLISADTGFRMKVHVDSAKFRYFPYFPPPLATLPSFLPLLATLQSAPPLLATLQSAPTSASVTAIVKTAIITDEKVRK